MPERDEDGWSIHVPTTGFQTADILSDGEPDPLLPSARVLRLVIHDGAGDDADDGVDAF